MTTPPPGQWFACASGALDGDRLTGVAAPAPTVPRRTGHDEVHVLLHPFEPGSEVRFGGLAEHSTTAQVELLTAAIRELGIVRPIFDD